MSDIKGLGTLMGGLFIGKVARQMDTCKKLYYETNAEEYRIAHNSFRNRIKNVATDLPPRLKRQRSE